MRRGALVTMLPIVALAAACSGGASKVATRPTSTSTSSLPDTSTTGLTTRAPGSTTTPATPPATTPTTAPPTSTPTTAPRTSVAPTTVAPVPTTSPGPPVTSYTHNPAVADCAAAVIVTAASTDAPSYGAGTPVTITVRVTNTGTARCQFAPVAGPGRVEVDNAAGSAVWSPPTVEGVYARPPYYTLAPGQSFVSGTWTWDQHSCAMPCRLGGPSGSTGPAVPAGRYTAVPGAEADGGPTRNATFVIR